MSSRDSVIPVNHLSNVETFLKKSLNLLNHGRDILPYQIWRDKIEEILAEINDIKELDEENN